MDATTQQDIDRVFAAQQSYRWTAKTSSTEHRRELLERLRTATLKHADALAEALYSDMAKPPDVPLHREVDSVLKNIDNALAHLDEWNQPVDLGDSTEFDGARLRLQYESRGVVLIFGPWNFPFQLLIEPLVPAIAAGNTIILKPNELTPATAKVTAQLIKEAFDEREIAVFEGGVDVSNALLDLPVDHIFFTGSPAVGKIIMTAAAKHLASVTLELGGKCPAIVGNTTDLKKVVDLVVEGRHNNGGQICLATDYALVPTDLRDEFVRLYWQEVDRKYYVDGKFNQDTMPRMVNERNAARIQSYIDDAVARGATLPRGGRSNDADDHFHPAVLLDVPPDAKVMQEEIFGPVLPVLTYDNVDDIIDIVRAGTKPLAMYIFSDDQDFVDALLAGTSSGGVTVNGWGSHWGEKALPFGGVNHSGIGRYHGIHGFKELSHERAILIHSADKPGEDDEAV